MKKYSEAQAMFERANEITPLNESKSFLNYQLLLETTYMNDHHLILKYSILINNL